MFRRPENNSKSLICKEVFQTQSLSSANGAFAGAPTDGHALPTGGSLRAVFRGFAVLAGAALVAITSLMPVVQAADDFLDPEVAFKPQLRVEDAGRKLVVSWQIAEGYHLYADKLGVASETAGVKLGELNRPKGEVKFDTVLNQETEKLHGRVEMSVPVVAAAGSFDLTVSNQGCAAAGLCYPPQERVLRVELPGALADLGTAGDLKLVRAGVGGAAAETPSEEASIESALASGSLWKVASLFLALGVLLSFTPCVLPMVPILSSIIVGQNETVTKTRGLAMSVAYSLGMALVYTSLGVAAGLAGEGLAGALQHPAVLGTFAALLFLLALSMFDVYTLQMPASIQSKLSNTSAGMPGGKMASVFVMGAMSALVVGPCVAAPLAGALVYISKTRDVVIGGVALFSMAVGMSVPLLLTGISAGSLLPRAGMWMNAVKSFFGVLLIAVAIWMVTPVLPSWIAMLMWGSLAVGCAVYLRVFDSLPDKASGTLRLGKAFGALLLLAGASQIVGVAIGGGDVLRPLGGLARNGAAGGAATQVAHQELPFAPLKDVAALEQAIAKADGPVVVDFYADWCVACKELETFTFTDDKVKGRLQKYTLLRADVTRNDEASKALLKRFGLFGPPGIVFLAPKDGSEIAGSRVVGFKKAPELLALLDRVDTAAAR